eukprot:2707728-Pyramimonas_sp.AAC.1
MPKDPDLVAANDALKVHLREAERRLENPWWRSVQLARGREEWENSKEYVTRESNDKGIVLTPLVDLNHRLRYHCGLYGSGCMDTERHVVQIGGPTRARTDRA